MTNSTQRWLGVAVAAFTALNMAGCAQPKRIYEWGNYQGLVYDHLKGQSKGPEQQIADLEQGVEKARSVGASLPPGYYAHLGLMYLTIGKGDQAVQAWNTEKTLFPESGQYVDFLLNNMKKKGG